MGRAARPVDAYRAGAHQPLHVGQKSEPARSVRRSRPIALPAQEFRQLRLDPRPGHVRPAIPDVIWRRLPLKNTTGRPRPAGGHARLPAGRWSRSIRTASGARPGSRPAPGASRSARITCQPASRRSHVRSRGRHPTAPPPACLSSPSSPALQRQLDPTMTRLHHRAVDPAAALAQPGEHVARPARRWPHAARIRPTAWLLPGAQPPRISRRIRKWVHSRAKRGSSARRAWAVVHCRT